MYQIEKFTNSTETTISFALSDQDWESLEQSEPWKVLGDYIEFCQNEKNKDDILKKKAILAMKEKIVYLCDGRVEECSKSGCYQCGGECEYTSKIEHARNFQLFNVSDKTKYMEKENTDFKKLDVIIKEIEQLNDMLTGLIEQIKAGKKYNQ